MITMLVNGKQFRFVQCSYLGEDIFDCQLGQESKVSASVKKTDGVGEWVITLDVDSASKWTVGYTYDEDTITDLNSWTFEVSKFTNVESGVTLFGEQAPNTVFAVLSVSAGAVLVWLSRRLTKEDSILHQPLLK